VLAAGIAGFLEMSFSKPEAKKGESKADAERRRGELLGE